MKIPRNKVKSCSKSNLFWYYDFNWFRRVTVHCSLFTWWKLTVHLMSILMTRNKQVTKFLKRFFFTEYLPTILLKFIQCLFLESFFISLNKLILLHHRYLICRNFLKFWYCCAEKYFLLFIRFYMRLSPIAMVSLLGKNLILSILLVLSDRKHFCSVFQFCFIKSFLCEVMIWRMFLQNSFQRSSRLQMFFKVDVLMNFPIFTRKRTNHQRCSVRKGVLRNFAKFKGIHLYQSHFLIKL